MKTRNVMTTTFASTLSALLLLTACGEGSDETPGDGDMDPATGGTVGATGGSTGGDGDMATGGTPGGDGDMASGGSTASPGVTFTFNTDLEGMVIDYEENFAGMGGAFASTLSHDSTDGDPDPGSAKLESPFDYTGDGEFDDLQKAHVAITLDQPLNMTDGAGTVNVKLVSGGSTEAECPVVAKMFLKTTDDFVWGNGTEGNLEEGKWTELSIVAGSPAYSDDGYDASDVRMVGVEVTPNSGDGCVSSDVVVLLDTISL